MSHIIVIFFLRFHVFIWKTSYREREMRWSIHWFTPLPVNTSIPCGCWFEFRLFHFDPAQNKWTNGNDFNIYWVMAMAGLTTHCFILPISRSRDVTLGMKLRHWTSHWFASLKIKLQTLAQAWRHNSLLQLNAVCSSFNRSEASHCLWWLSAPHMAVPGLRSRLCFRFQLPADAYPGGQGYWLSPRPHMADLDWSAAS